MKAVVFEKFGEPSKVLQVQDAPIPSPGPGEICVRMLASPVNPSDLMTIRGTYGTLPKLPASPGFEGVGIVEGTGGGLLGRYLQGRRVAVLNANGNWREKTVVPAKQAIPLPKGLDEAQGAMFFVNPATSFILTRRILQARSGQWLLQTAAGSALGRMVIRLGNRFGFRTLNVVRRANLVDELKSIGGDAVVHFDPHIHSHDVLREEVQRITDNQGVRFAIDPVGGETGSAVLPCLKTNGRLIVFGSLCDEQISFSARELIMHGLSIEAFWLGRWMQNQNLLTRIRLIRKVSRFVQEGILTSEVGATFKMEDVSDAVREAEKPSRSGKVLLRFASD